MRWTVGLAFIAVAACGGDKATAPMTIVGTYTLSTVGGATPPANVTLNGASITLTSGSIEFNDNGTVTETLIGTSAPNSMGQPISASESGTYTTQGDAVVINFTSGGGVTGSWGAHNVSLVSSGFSLVFKR